MGDLVLRSLITSAELLGVCFVSIGLIALGIVLFKIIRNKCNGK